jgi:hypothetical protein
MPQKVLSASTAYQTFFATPKHEVGKLTSLIVTNKTPTSVPVMVTLEDFFTPDASEGVASPTATSQEVTRMLVGAGLTGSLSKEELADIRVLGTCKMICDGDQSACYVDAAWHFE